MGLFDFVRAVGRKIFDKDADANDKIKKEIAFQDRRSPRKIENLRLSCPVFLFLSLLRVINLGSSCISFQSSRSTIYANSEILQVLPLDFALTSRCPRYSGTVGTVRLSLAVAGFKMVKDNISLKS